MTACQVKEVHALCDGGCIAAVPILRDMRFQMLQFSSEGPLGSVGAKMRSQRSALTGDKK